MRLPTTYFVFSPRLSRGVAAAFGFAVLVGMPLRGLSQQYLMGEEVSVTACGFYFLDDGGALHDASSSGDLTTTFCPETPGGELTFSFSTFSLAEGDTLFLWEGPDATGAPTYAFANDTLLGNDMGNGDAVTNPSGCLTWRFSPGAEGGSNWAALVSCSAPCNRPVVSATVNMAGTLQDSPVEACLGAVLAFDASGSVSAAGLDGSTWAWDFGDGTLSNAGSVVAHAYSDPGVYPVQLTLVDSAGCSSVNSLGWAVHVAAPISIDVPSLGPHVCAGGAAVLALGPDGVTTQSVASQPVASFGAGVMIPDSVGQAFSSEITFSGFPFGQSVSGVEDISGVLVNLEHSFILDLAIELECPNGSSMMLQGWPGGFGGCVDAGIPVTGDNPPDPGIGYDYSWSPGASEDWQSAALALLPSPTSGCASSTSPLPAGTYAATGDWSQLVGCPINGTWTMNILDTQEGDNGFLFGWSVDFAPDITPQQTVFEAAVGSGCDSMYWSPMEPWGFDMAEIGGCSSIVVEPTEAGSFGYVFTAVDAFGCSADTAVFITVEPGLDFAIGSNLLDPLSGVDPTLCAGLPLTLEATALSPVPPGTSFNWLLNGVGSGQLGTVYVDAAPDTGQQEILFQATTVAPPPIVGLCHFEWRDTIEVVVPPSVDLSVPDVCSNAPVLWEAPATGDGLGWSWLLSADNGDTLSQVTWAEPILGTQPPGAYTLEATVTDENGCADHAAATFEVFQAPDAGFSLDNVCAGEVLPFALNDSVGYAHPLTTASWSVVGGGALTDEGGHLGTSVTGGSGLPQITLDLVTVYPAGITCAATESQYAMVYSLPTMAIMGPDFACEGEDVAWWGVASVPFPGSVASSQWVLDGAMSLTQSGGDSLSLIGPPVGAYDLSLMAVSDQGCAATYSVDFDIVTMPSADFEWPATVCAGEEVEVSTTWPTGGTASHLWTANGTTMTVSGSTYPSLLTAAAGTIEVVHAVSIGGCSDTVTAVIEVSPLPVAGFAGPELACAGDAVVWSDNSVNPTVSPLTRTWAPLFAGPAPSSGVLYNFGVPGPGDYGMALTVTTAAGCSDSLTANLFVGERPDAAFALEPVCAGDSVPLDLSDPAGYPAASATWLWNGAPLTVPNTSSGIPSVLPPAFSATFGPQTAALSLALAHPGITCTSEHTETVAVFAQPTAAITAPSDFCAGPDADFASATVVDGGTPLTLDWSLDSGSGPPTLGDAPSVVLPSPAPGTYIATLTATTPDGCTSTAVDSVAVFAAPQADFTLPTTVCAGGSVAVPSLVTPGVLEWSLNGQPLATDAGTFHAALTSTFGSQEVGVTVTLGEGADQCVDQHTEVLEVEAYPLVNFTGPLAACEGDVAMWQEACVHPQGLPMSMVWSVNSNAMTGTPDNALDLNGLPTGIHDIVLDVAGPAGCTASSQGTFEVHPVPEAAFSLSEACSGLPITWEDEASEGMFFGAPSWSWNGALLQVQSDTLPVVVSALAGNPTIVLQLTMEYATGVSCQALDSATTVVHETPDAVIDGPGHLCAGDTGHFIGSGGAAASPLVFEWSLDEAATEADSTPSLFDFTSVNTGLYNLSLEVLSAAGCASEANTDVEVVAAPDADFELPEGACTGEVLPLTLGTIPDNAAIIDSTWTWNGTPINPSAESMPLELTSSPGVQWVSLQLSVSAGTAVCVSQANQEVEVHAVPEVVWDLPEEGCSGLPMSITSVAQIEGAVPLISSWTWIQGGDSVQAFGDAFDAGMPNAGLYTVALEVEGAGGCVAQLEGDLTLHPTPNADFSAADVCAGTPMSVTWPEEGSWPDSMALWTWNGNATTVVGGHFDPMVSAVYGPQMLGVTLSTEFASGHVCSDTHMVTAEVWPQPALGWDAPNGMCAGDVAQFSSSSTVVAGGILSTEWLWGAPSGVLSASGEVASFGVPDSGQYDLEMVVNTAQGCADTLAASLEVYPLPNVQFSMDPVCEGTPILVEWDEADVAAETTYTWTWSGEDFELQNNTLPIEASMNEGVQVVQLTGWHEYSNGVVCSDGYEAAVAVLTTPQAAIAADTLWCEGEEVTVHEAVTGQGEWTCQWSSDVGSASGSEWQLPAGALGHIPATLTVINAAGCSDTLAFNVRIDPVPHLMLSDSLVMDCAPFSPELQADISGYAGAVLSTVWTWAGGQSESAAWSEEVDVGAWPVSCTVATGDADLQCTATSTASVVGLEVPVAQFSMYPEQPTTRQPNVELTAQGVPSGAALEWSVNGVPAGQSAVVDYTFAPYFGDDYTVCLVAMSSFGCADEWCREVEVIGEVQVYVPSGFTPDNDGVNDLFLPAVTPLEQVEDYRLEVYNRWGDLVFATQNPEEGWMGAYRSGSHFAGNEVFNWVITIDTQLGLPRRMAGQVTVIR